MELKGRLALITGGARGIGLTIAEELSGEGAHVILGDVNLEGAQKAADSIKEKGGTAGAVRLDVGGRTLMPGLIDAHVHVTISEVAIARMEASPLTLMTAEAAAIMRGMLSGWARFLPRA